MWSRLPALLAGIVIALASSPTPAAGDEPREEPTTPNSHDAPGDKTGGEIGGEMGGETSVRDATAEPQPSPTPGSSNRASVRRYLDSIDPNAWLRRFGKVEKRERR